MSDKKRTVFDISTDIATINADLFADEEETEKKLKILFNELGQKEDGIWMWYKKIHQDIELADEYISKIQAEKKKRQNTLKSLKIW